MLNKKFRRVLHKRNWWIMNINFNVFLRPESLGIHAVCTASRISHRATSIFFNLRNNLFKKILQYRSLLGFLINSRKWLIFEEISVFWTKTWVRKLPQKPKRQGCIDSNDLFRKIFIKFHSTNFSSQPIFKSFNFYEITFMTTFYS